MRFKSESQRKAVFARLSGLANHFSFSSPTVSTGSGIADAIVNMYPDGVSAGRSSAGSSIADSIVNLYPNVARASKEDAVYTLYYPIDGFSEHEILAAREQFDFPKAWVLTKEGYNYKMVLDPVLVKKYYGGV